jgi:hypothetical protein
MLYAQHEGVTCCKGGLGRKRRVRDRSRAAPVISGDTHANAVQKEEEKHDTSTHNWTRKRVRLESNVK